MWGQLSACSLLPTWMRPPSHDTTQVHAVHAAHETTADAARPAGPPTVIEQLPVRFTAADKSRWEKVMLPGKTATRYAVANIENPSASTSLQADSQASASFLRQRMHIAPERLRHLRFSWRVEQLIEGADMGRADKEDSPVRIVLAFDGDKSRWSARTHMLNELARALTGEDMPYATLMYVWSNHRPAESVIHNPRTDRVRKIVMQSGPEGLKRWHRYERDIRADYRHAFGEDPGTLLGVALMTDTDNTRTQTRAWYGPIAFD